MTAWVMIIVIGAFSHLGGSASSVAVAATTVKYQSRDACMSQLAFVQARKNTWDAYCIQGAKADKKDAKGE